MILALASLLAVWSGDCFLSRRAVARGEEHGFFRREGAPEALLFLISFLALFLCNKHTFNFYNNYSYLAQALLKGRLNVPEMPEYLESIAFGGAKYMHFAPGPSLLCLPFVALFGLQGVNASLLAMALGALNGPLAMRLLKHLGIGKTPRERLWLSSLLVFGTVHFFLAALGDSWFFGQLAALFFLLLAMVLVTRPNAGNSLLFTFLGGLCFGLAVACRMSTLFGGLFFIGFLWYERKPRLAHFALFALGAAVFGGLYMAYNYARFGTIMDLGYNLTYLKDKYRAAYDLLQAAPAEEQLSMLYRLNEEHGGPLQFKHVAYNLYSIFALPPSFSSEYPYVIPTVAGVAVTITSPALFAALFAPRKKTLSWVLLAATLVSAVPFLLNYGNGMAQFGMRYSMDFTPFLFLLACMGLSPLNGWKKGLLSLCALINIWGALFWTAFYR